MRVLFLGADSGTSKHRANAIRRLGHSVEVVNPDLFVPKGKAMARIHWETGGMLCQRRVMDRVLKSLGNEQYDLTWVDNGRYVGPQLVTELQRRFGKVINYNVDDPFGPRDRFSWHLYRRTVRTYDLVVVVRRENIDEAIRLGARRVKRVFRSADEVAHTPRILTEEDHERWDSEVLFIGTWMPERGPFMAELIRQGVPLTIYGNLWQKAKEWPIISKAWRGPGTTNDTDYANAIQCAKICLGLLSKGNRDLHTTRSLEIPLLGGLFCAERTREHQQLYIDGEEAAFWANVTECAEACRRLLMDRAKREEIAHKGRLKCIQNGYLNQQVVAEVLSEVIQ